jgi:flagellar biosynthesis protein FlhG
MQIWAVAGGKGGTGKSLIANGLALGLAERGLQVILVDADYGGPNQHSYCGIRKPATNLGQFFEERRPLEELAVDTGVPGLRLVPGNLNTASTDSITWSQKQKLFRHLRLLRADHVVLDLGAGTQYDTLDTFLLADVKVGVILPDPLAIENFYLFLKNLKFRQLGNLLSQAGLRSGPRRSGSSGRTMGSMMPGSSSSTCGPFPRDSPKAWTSSRSGCSCRWSSIRSGNSARWSWAWR